MPMVVFWVAEKEYHAPEDWVQRQIHARQIAGANRQDAVIETLSYWAKEHEHDTRN